MPTKPEFKLNERVRVVSQEADAAKYVGQLGRICAWSEPGDDLSYGVFMYSTETVCGFGATELESTGEIDDVPLPDPTFRIRVRVDSGGGGFVV